MENDNSQLHYMQISVDHMDMMEYLTDEQRGIAFRHVFAFFRGEKTKEEITAEISRENNIILPIFDSIIKSIDRGRNAYEERCRKNRENGKKGGAPKGNQNARKKEIKQQPEEKQAPKRKETDTQNDSDYTETEKERDIKIMTKVAQNILKKMQTELLNYKSSLFKLFTKKQAISFLATFMTTNDVTREMSFDFWYKNGVISFLEDLKHSENVNDYLNSFKEYVKKAFLEDYEFTTIDDFTEEFEINRHAAANAVEAYLSDENNRNNRTVEKTTETSQ